MPSPLSWRSCVLVLLIGVGSGYLSGLFGVGGGLVIVPALISVVKLDQRRAAATSLAAIVLTATVGGVSYALHGEVSLIAAIFVIVGSLLGTQIGTRLLRRLPERILPWFFIAFVLLVVLFTQLHTPVREAALQLGFLQAVGLIIVGIIAGIMAGLVGVGGGSVIVPGLQLIVGVGDLLARGTSLIVMVPTAISGTISNVRHGLVDLCIGGLVGLGAVLATPLGAMTASAISPSAGNILFNAFLLLVVINTLYKQHKRTKPQ